MNEAQSTENVRVLVFDFDGTIVNSLDAAIRILNVLAKKYKFKSIQESQVEALRRFGSRELFTRLGIPLLKLPFLARDAKTEMAKVIHDIHPVEGLLEVLERFHDEKMRMFVLTSNSEENVRMMLQNNSVAVFEGIYSHGSLFGKHGLIKNFLKKECISPLEAVYIGDETRDIEAARKAGVRACAVTWGYNSEDVLREHKPDWCATRPRQLLEFFAAENRQTIL